MISLATLGVSIGPIIAGLGVLGIIVGLAIQDTLKDFAAGAMILVHRPYDIDDRIKCKGADGIVKKMNFFATTILTFDNQKLIVPNGQIWGDTIVNYTANKARRVDVTVSVAYDTDLDKVHSVLMQVLTQHDSVLEKPEPEVHMTSMADSAIVFVLKPWVKIEEYWPTLWDLNVKVKKQLDQEGIEIPFPQRVITLKSEGKEEQ